MTSTEHVDHAWLARFAGITRAEILRDYRPDSCIASTWIGMEVLRYYGIAARPQPVRVAAFTPDAWDACSAGRASAGVGYSVGVQGHGEVRYRPDGRSRWNGHLVFTLERPAPLLVDLAADQMHRPHQGIHVPGPVVLPIPDPDRWAAGDGLVARHAEGTVLTYVPFDNQTYRRARDWRGPEGRAVVARVIPLLRSQP